MPSASTALKSVSKSLRRNLLSRGRGFDSAPFLIGVSMLEFDSLNPYDNLMFIVGRDPSDLVAQLKAIRTPIKIHFIVPQGSNHVAYFTGDVKAIKKVTTNGVTEGTTRQRVRKV